jgi:putative DNA primase/helicase
MIDDDNKPKSDVTLVMAERVCKAHKFISVQAFGKIYHYHNGYYEQIKSPKCDAELHQIIMSMPYGRALSPAKRNDVIKNIEAMKAVDPDRLNPDGIFCFQDCLYDIRSNIVAEHDPQYLITIQLPYTLKTGIDAPMWMDFLKSVTQNDQQKMDILQEFAGYCLMKSCHFEKALFLIGNGSNGKSVFAETISKVFGRQNVSAVSLESLSNPVLRCNIIGKYINIDSDLPRNAERFEETFRKVTSGDPVLFNEKFVPTYTHSPFCKLIYCLNEFPTIDDATTAFYRRMLLVPFEVEFKDGEQDTGLKTRLESELPGIFRWCVAGYRRLVKQGFTKNTSMDKYVAEIRVDNNPIMAFVDEEIEIDTPEYGITKAGLYKLFKKWSSDHGHRCPAHRKFNNRFFSAYRNHTKKDAQRTTGDREKYWPNISFKNSANNIEYEQITLGFINE